MTELRLGNQSCNPFDVYLTEIHRGRNDSFRRIAYEQLMLQVQHYRDMAKTTRNLAAQAATEEARRDLNSLAISYDLRADDCEREIAAAQSKGSSPRP
ncbi:hypothetical protein ABDK56_12090 [Sphingomonas sp. ASV193]|uniref:hypothetical protein n=1 Tax=Sphingomonas sp. ASV193 TaxID=3144405 RepID=UPI0032E883F1